MVCYGTSVEQEIFLVVQIYFFSYLVENETKLCFSGCHGSVEKSSSGRITLGEQAAALANPHDRVVALRRVTAAAQVLLARTMVMRALSLLSVR